MRDRQVRGLFSLSWLSKIALCAGIGLLLLAATVNQGDAQQIPNIASDYLSKLQQMQHGSTPSQTLTPQQTILEPNAQPNPVLPRSRLEILLSTRTGVDLKQFGYDQLGVGRPVTLPQMGAVQDSYILGPGDEVVVSLRGQENSEYTVQVNRNGMVTLPRLSPVQAAGRTFGEFRRDLVNAIRRAYVSTQGYVSLGSLRQISVLVSGEVNSPGVRTLTGLSTAVDAILVSGGIKKSGSLRNVRILRGGKVIKVDLYSVLTGHGDANQVTLAAGDKIVVPPLGPTVAVTGWVRRPRIYEMPAGRSSIRVRDLLRLAGGLEVRGKYRMSILRVAPDGRNELVPVKGKATSLGDSDVLFVQPAASQTSSMATLAGGTPLAGQYPAAGMKLSELLRSPGALGTDPYTLFGIISRRDPVTMLRKLIPFTPVAVLKGTEDMNLQGDDIVRVISSGEARMLFTAVQQYSADSQAASEALRNPQSVSSSTASQFGGAQSAAAVGASAAAQSTQSMGVSERAALASAVKLSASQAQSGQTTSSQILPGTSQQLPAGQTAVPPQAIGPSLLTQQPSTQQPTMQQPGIQQPGIQQPGIQQPGIQQPGMQQPTMQQPEAQSYAPNLQQGVSMGGQIPTNVSVNQLPDLASQLQVDPLVLVNFLKDHSVNVNGAVGGPGLYLVGPDANLGSLIQAAGGLARWADRSKVEVISTTVDTNLGRSQTERRSLSLANGSDAGYIVSPHDEVRVNEVFTKVGIGSVTLQGEIRHVGAYQIVRGEHLSDVLMRAGGLTENAYPYGTVFLRRSVAHQEEDSFRRQATEIENQLLLAMSRRDPNSKLSPDAFAAMQGYVNQLKDQKALGRVTVTADPAVLAANPALDPLLQPGDVVFVPQRPYSVAVLGAVLQPTSVPFNPNLSVQDYIARAGGYSQFADESQTILVLPNGTARRVETSWLDFGSDDIPPGSTIFVARDVSGVDLHQIIVDTTSIASQLAVTAASLAVLSKQ